MGGQMNGEQMDALWEYALSHYRRPEVASLCLTLQDRWQADVNLLLTAGWLAEQKKCWSDDVVVDLNVLCRPWRSDCVLPQRAIRRRLRDVDDSLYRQALQLELGMEQHQLRMVEDWLASRPDRLGAGRAPLRTNLDAALVLAAGAGELQRARQVARLADALQN